ncbi:transposase-like zinc-binding domain-containing protein [Alistipes communis]|uniref:IS1/IS1595 family N-terminal zinc-binding domain-containing protein n=1 Tax=Alistipes communis TaxID=2585118 RepID=UPI003AB4A33D
MRLGHEKITCKFCEGICIKNGYQENGKQRYKCKHCHRKQQADYSYQAYIPITITVQYSILS